MLIVLKVAAEGILKIGGKLELREVRLLLVLMEDRILLLLLEGKDAGGVLGLLLANRKSGCLSGLAKDVLNSLPTRKYACWVALAAWYLIPFIED